MIEVFTKDNCAPCAGTKKFLNEHNVDYVERNIQHDTEAMDELIQMNFNSVPVVRTEHGTFAGLNIQKLRELV